MARPHKCRTVAGDPEHRSFRPTGTEFPETGVVEMTCDEFEAIRLADVEGLYQDEAAKRMQVSRQTFGNILASARRKLGEMLVYGRSLNIKGGHIMVSSDGRSFGCATCGTDWSVAHGIQRPAECPACASGNIHRLATGGGFGGGRRGGGRCRGFRTGLQGGGGGCGEGRSSGGGNRRGGCSGSQEVQGGEA